jgi:hypothetical protein
MARDWRRYSGPDPTCVTRLEGCGEGGQGLGTQSFVDTPFDGPRAVRVTHHSSRSVLRLGERPSIMLVQIEPEEEPRELGLNERSLRVYRVRYPLPAAARMLVVRPLVVLIGPTVVERDLAFIFRAADETCAATLQLGSLVSQAPLGAWLRRAITTVEARRREGAWPRATLAPAHDHRQSGDAAVPG